MSRPEDRGDGLLDPAAVADRAPERPSPADIIAVAPASMGAGRIAGLLRIARDPTDRAAFDADVSGRFARSTPRPTGDEIRGTVLIC